MKRSSIGAVLVAMTIANVGESDAGPINVSYTVSGAPGSYALDFSVTNNMLAWPTQNLYFFIVRLSVNDNAPGSPSDWFDNLADANWFNYGGSTTEYNNTWRTPLNNGVPPAYPLLPNAMLPGVTRSGFIVHIPDATPPTAVPWSAVSFGSDSYTGGGNFITGTNPGFEGIAHPTAAPEPSGILAFAFLFALGLQQRSR